MRTRAPIAAVAVIVAVGPSFACAQERTQSHVKLMDPNTRFHRVWVVGNGDSAREDRSLRAERDALMQSVTAPGNQGAGSTSVSLTTPTYDEFRSAIIAAYAGAQIGDEITIYFGGHGGTGMFEVATEGNEPTGFNQHIRLNTEDRVTDNLLVTLVNLARTSAGLLREDVTLLVIMDSCYGGGFTGGDLNIGETKWVTVVGSQLTCPFTCPGLFWGYWKKSMSLTLKEYVDARQGQVVTGDNVKEALNGYGLGPPPANVPAKGKKEKYDGPLPMADIEVSIAGGPMNYLVTGAHFTPSAPVQLLYFSDEYGPKPLVLAEVKSDALGAFGPVSVSLPSSPTPNAFIAAVDPDDFYDWETIPTDCNENGVSDEEDIAGGTSRDCFDAAAAPGAAGGPNGIPDECECVADWDRNGVPNSTDVSALINTFFADQFGGTTSADIDCNGVTNSTDVSEFINIYFAVQAGQLPFAGCSL